MRCRPGISVVWLAGRQILDVDVVYQNLLLSGVLSCPVRVLLEGIAVEVRPDYRILALLWILLQNLPTITAASGVFVVPPRSSNTTTLLEDDKVLAVVPLDQVNSRAYARDATTYNDHRSFTMVLVSRRYCWPSLRACHFAQFNVMRSGSASVVMQKVAVQECFSFSIV